MNWIRLVGVSEFQLSHFAINIVQTCTQIWMCSCLNVSMNLQFASLQLSLQHNLISVFCFIRARGKNKPHLLKKKLFRDHFIWPLVLVVCAHGCKKQFRFKFLSDSRLVALAAAAFAIKLISGKSRFCFDMADFTWCHLIFPLPHLPPALYTIIHPSIHGYSW